MSLWAIQGAKERSKSHARLTAFGTTGATINFAGNNERTNIFFSLLRHIIVLVGMVLINIAHSCTEALVGPLILGATPEKMEGRVFSTFGTATTISSLSFGQSNEHKTDAQALRICLVLRQIESFLFVM